MSRIIYERLAKKLLLATPTGSSPRDRPGNGSVTTFANLLVPSLCGARRIIWDCWKPWGISNLPRNIALAIPWEQSWDYEWL